MKGQLLLTAIAELAVMVCGVCLVVKYLCNQSCDNVK